MLATAVAAAVTTPVVFLSAAPAFAADAPTLPGLSQGKAELEDGPEDDEIPTREELEAAIAEAQAKVTKLEGELAKLKQDIRDDKVDEALKTELAAAQQAVKDAKAARTAADAALVVAQEAFDALPEDATEQQKADAAAALETAKQAVEDAKADVTAAELRYQTASDAYSDARVALVQEYSKLGQELEDAKEALAEAKDELAFWEEIGFEECKEDKSVTVAVKGPETVTAGTGAVFSLTVKNTSNRTLDAVRAYAFATVLPTDWEDIEDEEEIDRYITVEWSSATNPEWTEVTEEYDAIEVGALVKGGKADVKLRLTVDAETPAGEGVAFAVGGYENEDGSCGIGKEYSDAYFDVVEAGTGGEPTPTPTPSPSTTTPTPAPTATTGTGGNTGTTQQGGTSTTPVNNGTLAATGANDTLPLGAAAAAAVALGAGALVVARRRKAGADA
ncbi:peptidase [Streptomyces sp. NPDC003327]